MMHSKAWSLAAAGGLVVAGAALAGCGVGSGSGHAGGLVKAAGTGPAVATTLPAPTTTVPADPAPASTVPAASSPAAGSASPEKCATGNLSITLTGTQGAAGSTVSDLVFTNRGSAPCTMTGYPGVSLVAGAGGSQVGAPAARSAVAAVSTITLQPGKAAAAELRQAQAGNFPASTCHPTSTRGFRVYPPDNTAAAFVAYPGRGCANPSLGQPQLFVGPVTASTVPAASASATTGSAPVVTGPGNAWPVLVVRSFDGTVGYDGREPSTVAFSGDSTNIVSHLTWSSWTTSGAVGHGLLSLDNCDPNCAQGSVSQVPATIDLGTVVSGRYTTMTEKAGAISHRYSYPSDWATSAS